MHPLDVVRQSLDNWSDAELGALSVGLHMARQACDRDNPDDYTGDDLYDLAHLCAFAQDWNPANTAAQRYLASRLPSHRSQAYAISIGAFVHINAVDLAVLTARDMLRQQPYDAEVAYTIRYMKDHLENAGNPEALRLADAEHPKIVEALSKGVPLKAVYGDAPVGTGTLYQMAMELAFFEKNAKQDAAAADTAAELGAVLPKDAALTPEDRQEIASVNLQYRLLGTQMEPIKVIRSFQTGIAKTKQDPAFVNTKIGAGNFGAATLFVLFPDWCAQCKKMMPTLTQFAAVNADIPIHACGLIFPQGDETNGSDLEKELHGTNVLEVSPTTVQSFGAIDFPLGIVVDHAGTIRFIGALPSDAFNGNGYIEKVITRMAGLAVKPAPGPPKGN